jgi:hypothetical protein
MVQSIWCGDILPQPMRAAQTKCQMASSNIALCATTVMPEAIASISSRGGGSPRRQRFTVPLPHSSSMHQPAHNTAVVGSMAYRMDPAGLQVDGRPGLEI